MKEGKILNLEDKIKANGAKIKGKKCVRNKYRREEENCNFRRGEGWLNTSCFGPTKIPLNKKAFTAFLLFHTEDMSNFLSTISE